VIDIEAQDGREHIADVLAGLEFISDAAAVAGAEIEIAIGAKLRQPPLWPPEGHSKMSFSEAGSQRNSPSRRTSKRATRLPRGSVFSGSRT